MMHSHLRTSLYFVALNFEIIVLSKLILSSPETCRNAISQKMMMKCHIPLPLSLS